MYCNNSKHISRSFMCNNSYGGWCCVNCDNCINCEYCIDCKDLCDKSFYIGDKRCHGEDEFLEEVHKRYPKIYN